MANVQRQRAVTRVNFGDEFCSFGGEVGEAAASMSARSATTMRWWWLALTMVPSAVMDLADVMKISRLIEHAVGAKARSDVPTSSFIVVEIWWARRKNAFAHLTAPQRIDSPKGSSNLPRLRPSGRGWPCRSAGARPFPETTSRGRYPDRSAAGSRSCAYPRRSWARLLQRIGFRHRLVDLARHGRPGCELALQLLDLGLESADLGNEGGPFVRHRTAGPADAVLGAGRYRAGAGVEPQHAPSGMGASAVAAVFGYRARTARRRSRR